MKPVIKKQIVYSVLLMRDDCGVVRFRLRAFWLKSLCVLALLLAFGAGGGIWTAYYYWKRYSLLTSEYQELQNDAAESRLHLERLATLEKFLQSSEVAHTRVSTNSANATVPVQAALSATGAAAAPEADPAPPSETVDSAVKLANLGLRASGANRLRLSFDLVNQNPQQTLTGRVNLALLTTGGSVVELSGSDDDLRFYRIARYKKIITTVTLPSDLPADSLSGLRIIVDAEGNPPYMERVSIP